MSKRFFHIIESVLNDPHGVQMPEHLAENFNKCLSHISELMSSSAILCKNGKVYQALFLAITAVEEATKAEIFCYRKIMCNDKGDNKPSKDCLKKHDIKHQAAVNEEVLLIGQRVQDVIGKELTEKIYKDFGKGKTREVREGVLYFDVHKDSLALPSDHIDKNLALAYILACIEIIDDMLVGLTMNSFDLSKQLDDYFEAVRNLYLVNE